MFGQCAQTPEAFVIAWPERDRLHRVGRQAHRRPNPDLRAVIEYGDISCSWLAMALARPRSLRGGLRAVYRYARDFYLAGGDAPRGCFLLGTAVTEANRDPEVRAIVEETMASFTATVDVICGRPD